MEPSAALITTTLADVSTTGGIGSLILILVVVIIPFIWKFLSWSKETSAQGVLYSQLSDLVQKQREELDAMYVTRNIQQEQIFELRHKIEHMEGCESTVELLKKKLDQKDAIIAERDSRIAALLEELLKMKDRVHNLELRLKADEAKFCEGCRFKIGKSKEDKSSEDKPREAQNIQHISFLGEDE